MTGNIKRACDNNECEGTMTGEVFDDDFYGTVIQLVEWYCPECGYEVVTEYNRRAIVEVD